MLKSDAFFFENFFALFALESEHQHKHRSDNDEHEKKPKKFIDDQHQLNEILHPRTNTTQFVVNSLITQTNTNKDYATCETHTKQCTSNAAANVL